MIKKSYLVLSCALAAWALLAGCSDEIAGPNRAPVANAGLDQVVIVNDTVFLDGGGSFDPDGDKLIYHWKLLVAPGIDAPIAGDDQTGNGGGDGGRGGSDGTAGGEDGFAGSDSTAGGGGGAAGRIRINTLGGSASIGGTVSPDIASGLFTEGFIQAW